ncbi:MAG: vitamin B12-dependent ribonucleotide reductase, partial [Candidatus Aenigmatarchaeota archaeon]
MTDETKTNTLAEELLKETKGLKINRFFTKSGVDPLDQIEYDLRSSVIRNTDGSVVFQMNNVEVPKFWSQVATDILAQKYFRKAGVPQVDSQGRPLIDMNGNQILSSESSIKQVVHRIAGCWTFWGKEAKMFATDEDAQAFYDETVFMLVNQFAAPNSPQWFNTGLNFSYGITGPPQGHYYMDFETKEILKSKDSYSHPQVHACYIQPVRDDLVNEGGIMDLWLREARIFKYGSGTGTNFSSLRGSGEPLSGGGKSSGLMSFLKIGDRAAGAIKSGGTTRRAAKMAILNLDHPDIEQFINWKVEEEKKVAAMIAAGYSPEYESEAYSTVSGQNSNNSVRVPNKFMKSLLEDGNWDLHWRTDGRISKTMKAKDLWAQICSAAWACADPGLQFDDT